MKKIFSFLLLSFSLFGQNPQNLNNVTQLNWQASSLAPVSQVFSNLNGQSGTATYYYWIVAKYVVGNASPSNFALALNSSNALNATNFNLVSWVPPSGSTPTGYDILRTTVPFLPNNAANILLASVGANNLSYFDEGASPTSYTVNTFSESTGCSWTISANNIISLPCVSVQASSVPASGIIGQVTIANGGCNATTAAGCLSNLNGVSTVQTGAQTMSGPLITTSINGAYDLMASFGAVCDGATDDSTPISTAIASGHSIWVRDGVTCVFSTPQTMTSQQIWFSNGTNRATLKYTGTSGTAWTMNGGQSYKVASGFRNITLSGPGATGNTDIGITLGGSSGGFGFVCEGCNITGWGNIALFFASNTYFTNIKDSAFQGNGQNVQYPVGGVNNSGENIVFDHDLFAAASSGYEAAGVNILGQPQGGMTFRDCSFDNVGLYAAAGVIKIEGSHFEINPGYTATTSLIRNAGALMIINGADFIFDGGTSLYSTAVSAFISASAGFTEISNVVPTNFSGLPNLALLAVSGSASADVGSLSNFTNSIGGGISQLVVGATTGVVTQVKPSVVGIPTLAGTSNAPTVTPTCTASCSTSYSYVAVQKQWDGSNAPASSAVTTAVGAATLNSTNYNTLVPNCGANTFSVDYYRQVNSGTQQFVGNGFCSANFVDKSFNVVTQSAPTSNTSGVFVAATGILSTGLRSGTASNTDLVGTLNLSGGTQTQAFTGTYTSAPICLTQDQTTYTLPSKGVVTGSGSAWTLTITGTGTDVINYSCIGRN